VPSTHPRWGPFSSSGDAKLDKVTLEFGVETEMDEAETDPVVLAQYLGPSKAI
jgi:hypothetical protein